MAGAFAGSEEIDRAARAFHRAFGRAPEVAARAPGRVNWIGEHTDYEEGLVLPSAIDRDTLVLGAHGPGDSLEVESEALGRAGFRCTAPRRAGAWIDYVQGVVWALSERGHELGGASLWIGSRVPAGAGLSSSAALGVGVAFALDALFGLGLGARELALVAHRGENAFVGIGCGILDPFASALGRAGSALRIDCRDQSVREVRLGGDVPVLLVAHSGVERRLAEGGYRERVDDCRAAFAAARQGGLVPASATALRDLRSEDLEALARLVEPRLLRRARHVISENARVDRMASALEAGDLETVGRLLGQGQASLRDDFEVSVAELDLLCELADAEPGAIGSRLTGAGFGGCTLHLVRAEAADEVAARIQSGFEARFGRRPEVHRLRPSDGAALLELG